MRTHAIERYERVVEEEDLDRVDPTESGASSTIEAELCPPSSRRSTRIRARELLLGLRAGLLDEGTGESEAS